MVRLLLIITSVFFTACVSRAPQKIITKKKNRMTCFERLDTLTPTKEYLNIGKRKSRSFPKSNL